MKKRTGSAWVKWFGILIGAFLLVQLVPYGRAHTNPAVIQEPQWQDTATSNLVRRACYDCHSNETTWPWYSNVAPMSWLIQHDVDEGRQRLNFSEWGVANGAGEREGSGEGGGEIGEVIQEGEMPPAQYLILHQGARLTEPEKAQLISGLSVSLGMR